MNTIPNPALGRRLRRAVWQCLLLVLVGLALSSTARAQAGYWPAMNPADAGPGEPGRSSDIRNRAHYTA